MSIHLQIHTHTRTRTHTRTHAHTKYPNNRDRPIQPMEFTVSSVHLPWVHSSRDRWRRRQVWRSWAGPRPDLLPLLHPLYLAELWINNDVGGEPGRDGQRKIIAKGNKHTLAVWRENGPRPGLGPWIRRYMGTRIHWYLWICGRVKDWQGWTGGRANRRTMEKAGAGMNAAWGRGWAGGALLPVET